MNRVMSLLLVICWLVAPATPAQAQTSAASLVGIVKDATGRILVGVVVTVRNEGTGATRTASTNASGTFDVSLLPPASYRVEAELRGFKKAVREGVALQVNQRLAIDLVLEVGTVTEEVTVQADAALLDTQSATIGTVIGSRLILGLPLNGRDFFQLSTLVPLDEGDDISLTMKGLTLGTPHSVSPE